MRLWHKTLVAHLPNLQLVAQWRELNSIFKKQDNHILINYIYEYPKQDLFRYTLLVIYVMHHRGFKINSYQNAYEYFKEIPEAEVFLGDDEIERQSQITAMVQRNGYEHIFDGHHNARYLRQCYYNLEEKCDRGQKGFSKEQCEKIKEFVFKGVI